MKAKIFLGGAVIIIILVVIFTGRTNLFKGMLQNDISVAPEFSFLSAPLTILPNTQTKIQYRLEAFNKKTPFIITSVCFDLDYNNLDQISESHLSGKVTLRVDNQPVLQHDIDATILDGVCGYINLPTSLQVFSVLQKPHADVDLIFNISSLAPIGTEFTPIVGIFGVKPQEIPSSRIRVDLPARPIFSVHPNSPSGAQPAGVDQIFAKFQVKNEGLNTLNLDKLDIMVWKTGVNLSNINLYPVDVDRNMTFAVEAINLSSNSVRFNMAGNSSFVIGGFNNILPAGTKSFVIRGDVVATAQGGSMQFGIADLGSAGTNGRGGVALGNGDLAPDIEWKSGSTTYFWTPQSSPVYFNSSPLSYGSASGLFDTTRPVISSVVVTDATADNALTAGSTIVVTFSEPMDPASFGTTTIMAPGTAYAPGNATVLDIFFDDNDGDDCITGNAHDALKIYGLACIDLGASNIVAGDITGTVTSATLASTTGAQTLTLVTGASLLSANNGAGAAGQILGSATFRDLNGNYLKTTASSINTVPVDW